jgi:outer membrane receptor protein involved in Fe transport
MGNNRKLQYAIRAALATAAASAIAPMALAQTAPAASPPALEEVVVTGSRIQSPNVAAMSPITTVTSTDILQTGLTRTEDILNNLPMVFAGQNSTVSNGADGTATVNLRGLGPQRTLVLVNGRRLGPGTGDGRNFSDINQVPAALIDRIDIFTGGASSVYGADAVSGVVNFVLNTHFEGVKVDGGYNFFEHHQHNSAASVVTKANDALPDSTVDTGFGKNASILMGSNFADNKGNATFYATYDTKAAVLQAKYDYSSCVLQATKAGGLHCGGSGTSARNGAGGYFQAYSSAGAALFTNTVDGTNGQFRPYDFAHDLYNFGPLNFYQTPNNRWTGGAFVNYEINEHVTAYSEVMYTRNDTRAQIAASGDFFLNSFIPCADPLLTAQERTTICSPANLAAQGNPTQTIGGVAYPGINMYIGRRNVEGGGRVATFTSDAIRTLVGVKGDFLDAWKYDVYAQRGTVDGNNGNVNYFSNAFIQNALTVVPGVGGAPTCASVINKTDTRCVPWNIWVPGGVTPAALNYLQIPLLIELTTTEEVASGSVTGDLGKYGLKVPTAKEGLQFNFGGEWRSESAAFSPDLQSQLGNAAGSGGPTTPVSGKFMVRELFTELSVPIANDLPFAHSAGFDLGYRYSSYSEGFKTNTYKMDVEWAPVQDIRFRASYSRAVRAPNILELFAPQAVVLDGSTDPCSGTAAQIAARGITQAQCLLAGVTAGEFGHVAPNAASQYNGLLGGNPNLTPETSDTYSAGFVFQPTFLPNLTLSVDWFDIKLKDTVGPIGADTILANCIATGSPSYCGAIHRDGTGSLWRTPAGFVADTNVNFGSLSTKGIDVKTSYRQPLPVGSLSFGLEGTKLINLDTQPLTGGPSYDCTGFFGTVCGASNPSWRHVLNTTWSTPWDGLDLTLRWRYIGSAESEQLSSNPQLSGKALPLTSNISAYNYLDLSVQFGLAKNVRLQLGVNNITDKDPPTLQSGGNGFGSDCPTITSNGSSCNGNTWPGTYDAMGRFLFAHVTAQF